MPDATAVTVEPAQIDVSREVIDDLRQRLAHTRWFNGIESSGWDYGTDLDYLRELCAYWSTEFDW